MIGKFIEFLLGPIVPEKPAVDLAAEKILNMKKINNHGLTDTDPANGSYFAVGNMKYEGSSYGFDYMTVNFGNKQEDVVIKYRGDIVFYFNTSEEVQVIRDAIIQCYNNMVEQDRIKKMRKFSQL